MTKMEMRRTFRISADRSSPSAGLLVSRRLTNSEITRSFEIMIDSATLATMTMAVAAERPPMKAIMASTSWPPSNGTDRT